MPNATNCGANPVLALELDRNGSVSKKTMKLDREGQLTNSLLHGLYAKSIVDYIFRWLELKFITGEQGELFKALPMPAEAAAASNATDPVEELGELIQMGDSPACNICGSLMVRSGTCYRCGTCGGTSGCS